MIWQDQLPRGPRTQERKTWARQEDEDLCPSNTQSKERMKDREHEPKSPHILHATKDEHQLERIVKSNKHEGNRNVVKAKKKQSLHSMVTPWPLHIWGLDLVRPVNSHSQGNIWILMAIEYFTKWIRAIPLCKAIGGTMANFTKENIIVWFGVPHRILSDSGTPFVNRHVRKMLEFYQVKHHR